MVYGVYLVYEVDTLINEFAGGKLL
jgi:hypothetical protein